MTLARYAKLTEKFLHDNSPAMLTGIAVVGTITTAYLTGKATVKAVELLDEQERMSSFYDHGSPDRKEQFLTVWKLYIPAVGTGLLTISSIVGANQISTRRATALAAAYKISERAYSEYRDKVIEKFGETKEQQVRDEIAQDRMRDNPSGGVIVVGGTNVLCFDKFSGRYFESSMEEIKSAMNWVNYEITHSNYASLGDFYSRLGLTANSYSEEVGWNTDHLLDIMFSSVISDENKPALALDFTVTPVRHYHKFG